MADQKFSLAEVKAKTVDKVQNEVAKLLSNNQLVLPQNYSEANALKSAWLILQEVEASYKENGKTVKVPALQYCTQNSVMLSLMDMVIQGLSPNKKQCYFIAYGKKLQMFRSYFGTIAVLKRTTDIKDVYAQVVRAGDKFDFETIHGIKKVISHVQTLESLDTEIIGAYATFIRDDGSEESEVMTISQIKNSWKKSKTVTFDNSTHKEFEEEMCKRTVLNRGAKLYLNTSDDSDLLSEAINREYDNEEENAALLPEPNSVEIDANDFTIVDESEQVPFSDEPVNIEESTEQQMVLQDLE